MKRLLQSIGGAISFAVLTLNLFFWGTPLTFIGMFKIFAPTEGSRRAILAILVWLAERWSDCNSLWFSLTIPTRWTLRGFPDLSREGHYLLLVNHQSWADIPVIFHTFRGRVPFIRFFLKQELVWVPIIGFAAWAIEFPFMRRFSPEYLRRHPEKRGTDLETTRRACQRYRGRPVTILNYLEGTRFTPEKQREQASPYKHLLRPRPGGLSFVLATLGDQLHDVLDVTIAYRGASASMWDFVCGRIEEVIVDVHTLDVPPEFLSVAVTEKTPLRARFKEWLEALWTAKDDRLEEMKNGPS